MMSKWLQLHDDITNGFPAHDELLIPIQALQMPFYAKTVTENKNKNKKEK